MFCFWTVDDEDDPPILQACRGSGAKREWCFYVYGYDVERRRLFLEANPETGNLFGLPDELQMIDLDHPDGKDEKVWGRVLRMWEEHHGNAVFQKAKEMFSGWVEQEEEYKLTDVQISRNKITLVIDRLGKPVQYELPIEAYDFLSEINPSQSVSILKHTDDDEIYVGWTELGYVIRLAEFTIVE